MKTDTHAESLILASESPRRRYLLRQAGLTFRVLPSGFDETAIAPCSPETYVRLMADGKAAAVSCKHPHAWVIGADTIVLIGDQILEKPDSISTARTMLKQLSGKLHKVITGWAIRCEARNRFHAQAHTTEVRFKTLTESEIEWYIRTKEPFDKAGAYAVQGLGTFLVKSINGSYTNVVGLPVCEVIEFLIHEGIIIRKPHHDQDNTETHI